MEALGNRGLGQKASGSSPRATAEDLSTTTGLIATGFLKPRVAGSMPKATR